MANTNNNITNAQALAWAVEQAQAEGNLPMAEKLQRMHTQATKPRKQGEKQPSKDKLANQANARKLAALMIEGETYGSDWVMQHGDCIITAQKATGVMREGMAMGLFAKADPVKGKVRYCLA